MGEITGSGGLEMAAGLRADDVSMMEATAGASHLIEATALHGHRACPRQRHC